MHMNTAALVLRVTEYKDRDALLTLLTSDHGVITAKARGVRRKNSPLAAACQFLVLSEFTLFEYFGRYTVNEAHPIELFAPLRGDLVKLSLGSYFAQVIEVVSQEDVTNRQLQSLILNSLFALSSTDIPLEQIKATFELRVLCLVGYTPAVYGCRCHSGKQPIYFDLSEGMFLCEDCADHTMAGIRLPVTAGTFDAIHYIVCCDGKRLLSYKLGEENLHQLSSITEAYLVTQLERGFSTLDYYKSLLI